MDFKEFLLLNEAPPGPGGPPGGLGSPGSMPPPSGGMGGPPPSLGGMGGPPPSLGGMGGPPGLGGPPMGGGDMQGQQPQKAMPLTPTDVWSALEKVMGMGGDNEGKKDVKKNEPPKPPEYLNRA